MTELGVNVCTVITFGSSPNSFSIPDALCIQPQDIFDDKEDLYRISISNMNADKNAYTELFTYLDRNPFVSAMSVALDGDIIKFDLAYVTRTVKPYGIFYDIEAMKKDMKFKKGKNGYTKSKEVQQ